jgi:DNA-binding transcriptional ArsR family regulator
VSSPFEEIAGLGRLIHEPARLAITSALAACERADFLFLLRITGLSKGNLSSHLSKLEGAGLVEVEKAFEGKIPRTWVRLTRVGRDGVAAYWERLEVMGRQVRTWRPEEAADDGA